MTPTEAELLEQLANAAGPLLADHDCLDLINLLARTTPGWYRENPKRLRLIGFALIRAGADRDLVNQALNQLGV